MATTFPVGPVGIPGIGPVLDLSRSPLDFLERTAREYGDVSSFREGPGRRVVLLNHPELIETLLVSHAKHTIKDRITRKLRRVIGDGLVTSTGEHWKRQRRLAAPSFTPGQIAHYGDQMVQRTVDTVAGWEAGETRDALRDMMALTLGIVLDTLFGEAADQETASAVGDALDSVMTEFDHDIHTWRLLLPEWVPTAGRRRMDGSGTVLDEVLGGIIRAGREREVDGKDLMSRLLAARDEHDGRGMSDEELRDELMTLFVAGHETTGLALFYTLHLLGKHPEVAAQLRAEVDTVLGDRSATVADLPALEFTRAVVNESMRVYPPVWIVGREVVEPFELGGYRFESGTQLLASQWLVHHDARWFDQPDEFRPARWLTPKERPRFAFFPFGGGPRVCIGNHFAMMELMLVIATLTQRSTLELLGPESPDLVASVTLRPKNNTRMRVGK